MIFFEATEQAACVCLFKNVLCIEWVCCMHKNIIIQVVNESTQTMCHSLTIKLYLIISCLISASFLIFVLQNHWNHAFHAVLAHNSMVYAAAVLCLLGCFCFVSLKIIFWPLHTFPLVYVRYKGKKEKKKVFDFCRL